MKRAITVLLTTLALAACVTPAVQPPMTPPAGFAGPSVQADALIMDDSARLPLTRWSPTSGEAPDIVIIALHGVNDSRAAFRLAAAWWAEQGIETWAYDQRGFGGAPGKGIWAGEARMVQDLRVAAALARASHPDAIIAVAGESMGGAVAISAFGSALPPAADRLVLLAPAVWGWSSQDLQNRISLRLTARLIGDRSVQPPEWIARDRWATDNRVELYRTGRDPESVLRTRFDALHGLVDLMESASGQLERVRAPTLLLYGARDSLVPKKAMRLALERVAASPDLRTGYYPDGWHLLNRDFQAERVFRDVEAWLRDPRASLPSGVEPVLPALRSEARAR